MGYIDKFECVGTGTYCIIVGLHLRNMTDGDRCTPWASAFTILSELFISITSRLTTLNGNLQFHYDLTTWKRFPYYWQQLWGESTDDRCILSLTRQLYGALMCSLLLIWTRCSINGRVASDFRCHYPNGKTLYRMGWKLVISNHDTVDSRFISVQSTRFVYSTVTTISDHTPGFKLTKGCPVHHPHGQVVRQ